MGVERAKNLLRIAVLLAFVGERVMAMCEKEMRKARLGARIAWSIGPEQAGMMNSFGEVFIMTMTFDDKMSTPVKQMNFDISDIRDITSSAGDIKNTIICDSGLDCIFCSRQGNIISRGAKSKFSYSNSQVKHIKDAVKIDSQFYGLLFENFVVVLDTRIASLTGFERGALSTIVNIYHAESIHGICSKENNDGNLYYLKNWTLCNHNPTIGGPESCFNYSQAINITSQLNGEPHPPLGCDISASTNHAVIGSYYGLIVIDLQRKYVNLLEVDVNGGGAGYPKFFTYKADSIEYVMFLTSNNELARATYSISSSQLTILNKIRFHSQSINQNYLIEKVPGTTDDSLYFGKVGTDGVFNFKMTNNPGQLDLFSSEIDTTTFRQITDEVLEYQYIGRSLAIRFSRKDGSILESINYLAPPLDFSPKTSYDYIYKEGTKFKVWNKKTRQSSQIGNDGRSCYGGINISPLISFTSTEGVYIGITGYQEGYDKGQRILNMTYDSCYVFLRNRTSETDYIAKAIKVRKFGPFEFLFIFFDRRILTIQASESGVFDNLYNEKRFELTSDDKIGNVRIITNSSLIVNINRYRTDFFTFYSHNISIIRIKTVVESITELMYVDSSTEYWLIGKELIRYDKDFDESTAFRYNSHFIPGPKLMYPFSGNSSLAILSPTGYSTILFHESWLCIDCHPDCLTCSGVRENECLTCDESNFKLDQATFKCLPDCGDSRFINKQNRCEDCYQGCTGCTGPDKNQCTKCPSGYELDFSNSCAKSCDSIGQFRDVENNSCQNCPENCIHCKGLNDDDCTECSVGYELVDKRCLQICPSDNYRKPKPDYGCSKCNNFCLKCTGPEITNCNLCNLNSTFIEEKTYCQPICDQGFYASVDECLKCHDSCKSCSGGTEYQCRECFNNYKFLLPGRCVCQTNDGYFMKGSSCVECHSSCKTCTGISLYDCVECKANLFTYEPIIDRIGGEYKCRTECPKNSFAEMDTRRCIECHESCQECFGPLETNCKTCKTGALYFRGNNTCIEACPPINYAISEDRLSCDKCGSNCFQCQNFKPTICIKCVEESLMYLDNCYIQCPRGTRPDNSPITQKKICVRCPRYCGVCEGDICKECDTNYLLVEGRCLTFCPTGYGLDPREHICKKIICLENCDVCLNSVTCSRCEQTSKSGILVLEIKKNCIECKEAYGLIQVGSNCQETCGDGYLYKFEKSSHQCDDGNKKNGDGCTNECKIERGFTCSREYNLDSENMKTRDLCQIITKGSIELDSNIQAQVRVNLVFTLDVVVNPQRISTNYNLNYTSNEGNTTLLQYDVTRIDSKKYSLLIDNEALTNSKEDFKGTISLVQNRELSNEELFRDKNEFVVDMSSLSTDFKLSVAALKSAIKIKNIQSSTKSFVSSTMIQTILAIIILNPLVYDMAVNVLQKLIYIRVLDIRLSVIFDNFLLVVCSSLEFNPGKTDFDEAKDQDVSFVNNLLGLSSQDLNTLPKFQEIGMSGLFIKSGLPFLIIGTILYLLAMIVEISYNKLTGLFMNKTTGETKRLWKRKHWMWREILEFLAENLIWRRVVLWFLGTIPRLTMSVFLDLRGLDFSSPTKTISSIVSALSFLILLPLTLSLISTSKAFFSLPLSTSRLSFLLPFKPSCKFSPYYLPLRYIARPVLLSFTHVFFYSSPAYVLMFGSLLYLTETVFLCTFNPCKSLLLTSKFILENTSLIAISVLAWLGQQKPGQPDSSIGELCGWFAVGVVVVWGAGVLVLGNRL